MVITIGFNGSQYTIELYVTGFEKVQLLISNPMQIIYLIRMMHPMYPVSIAWSRIPLDIKQAVIQMIRDNVTV